MKSIISLILRKIGADINGESEPGGYSPINRAVAKDQKDVVRWLVARGAHLGEQESGTPLNNAVWFGNPSMLLLLMELNADPNLLGAYVRLLIDFSNNFLLILVPFTP